jgi:hypothetical protein
VTVAVIALDPWDSLVIIKPPKEPRRFQLAIVNGQKKSNGWFTDKLVIAWHWKKMHPIKELQREGFVSGVEKCFYEISALLSPRIVGYTMVMVRDRKYIM